MPERILIAVLAAVVAVWLSSSSFAQSNPDDVYWDNTIAITGGGLNGTVTAMTVYDGKLIVAGEFTTAGGNPANHIAAWDGTTWLPLSTGSDSDVVALAVYRNLLIAAGRFRCGDSGRDETIAAWDGSAWQSLGAGSVRVNTFFVRGDSLFAGGDFSVIGETQTIDVACWNGSRWSAVGDGFDLLTGASEVRRLAYYDGKLMAVWQEYADCPLACTCCTFYRVSVLTDEGWARSHTYSEITIGELVTIDGTLVIGQGICDDACDFPPGHKDSLDLILVRSGDVSVWAGRAQEGNGVRTITWFDRMIIAGGYTNIIASWDGSNWTQLGSGVNGCVNALTEYKGVLIVGGRFTRAGEKTAFNVACWTKRMNGRVWHVAVDGSDETGDGSEQSPFATIQHGIAFAFSGDTIQVAPGTYTGPGNRGITFAGKNLVVKSQAGRDRTTIDCGCGAWGCDGISGFIFANGESPNAVLDGFTITGAGKYVRGPLLDETVASDSHGGGIVCYGSSPTIRDCTVGGNWGDAGGIYCVNASPHIVSNRIEGNSGTPCGYTDISYGGIACFNSNPVIEGNVISENFGWYQGGALYLSGSNPVIQSNLIIGNYCTRHGANIVCSNGSSPVFTNNTIVFNRNRGLLDCVYDKSFAGYGSLPGMNTSSSAAPNRGGTAAMTGVTFDACIIAYNDRGSFFFDGTGVTLSCSDLFGNEGGDWVGDFSGMGETNNNLSVDPGFCTPGGWSRDDCYGSNGGDCYLLRGVYQLQASSPCAASNNECGALIGVSDVGSCAYPGPVWWISTEGDDNTGDGSMSLPFATIQKGIDAAPRGDTVLVLPGTYTGPGNRDIDFHGKDIQLNSVAWPYGAEETIIDCQGSQAEPHRGFLFHNGETNAARVYGFTITNGYAPEDDTIVTDIGTLVYARGGGIFCDSGSSPTISACKIINNHALWKGHGSGADGGGGLYCYKSSPVLEDNVISGNTSGNGGGVALVRTNARMVRNLITENQSTQEAGGLALIGSTDVLESNTISGNGAVVGGGVWLSGASPNFQQCILAFNSGGSLACSGSGNSPVLRSCVLYEAGNPSWPACVADQLTAIGNYSLDPLFCDVTNGDYHLSAYSPCLPSNNYWGYRILIGALGKGCGDFVCGDADMDGQATPADVDLLRAYYFSTGPTPYIPVGAADMDCNDRLSLNDLVLLAGYVYGFGPFPCCDSHPKRFDLPNQGRDGGVPPE